MKPLIPYLFFNGNCREAMNFYKECFGGELQFLPFSEAPKDMVDKNADKDAIMHAYLSKGNFAIMASDRPGNGAISANNIHLNLECETHAETDLLFGMLSKKGKVTQALETTFWGAYFGMLIDHFGIHWMLNCHIKK